MTDTDDADGDANTGGGTDAETCADTDDDLATDEDTVANGDTPVRTAIVVGLDDDSLGAVLADRGIEVERIDGVANREALENAGIADTSLFVLTDVRQATAIPVAKDLNPDLRAVIYARDSIPEFARGQADLQVDPDLLAPAVVAEELAP